MNRQQQGINTPLWETWWAWADDTRRLRGNLMELAGLGPQTTASRTATKGDIAHLLAYQTPTRHQSVLLVVPAPIKAAYIWDLLPEISVVRRCRDDGFQVYLVEWQASEQDGERGLEEYSENVILNSLRTIAAETGATKVFIAGHSLGGTLAAIFASLHPETIQGLIELEGPIVFSRALGSLEAAISRSPPASAMTGAMASVAGSFMNIGSSLSDSTTFSREPWVDWLRCSLRPDAIRLHGHVRRWTLDEMPMPRHLFEQIIDDLYRENRFARKVLTVGARSADPGAITAPILAVFDPRSRIIPFACAEAYQTITNSRDVEILQYTGDVGVVLQHVGVLVGENAHRFVWPRIIEWMRRHSTH